MSSTLDEFKSHKRAAEIENVDFLIESGMSARDACARVGILKRTYEKRKERQ